MIYFLSFLYLYPLISRTSFDHYPLGLKNWPAGSVICSRWTWLRLNWLDEKLNNAYWFSLCFAIIFLSLHGSKQLVEAWDKNNFENDLKDIFIVLVDCLYLFLNNCLLHLVHIYYSLHDCQCHLWFIFILFSSCLWFCTWQTPN